MPSNSHFTEDSFKRHSSVALLLPYHGWQLAEASYRVGPGLYLSKAEGSRPEQLYHHLCETQNLDDGSPFMFGVIAQFDPTEDYAFRLDFGDPYSAIDRFANLLVIETGSAINNARIIWSDDDFESAEGTYWIYTHGPQVDFLMRDYPDFTSAFLAQLTTRWEVVESLWHDGLAQGRVVNAMTYFYYAWRSHYLDQSCVHLGVSLETLFAPHFQGETTHQIAFNAARYVAESPDERAQAYRRVKTFYALRSSVVHGGRPDQDDLIKLVPDGFNFVAKTLRQVLSSEAEAHQMEDDAARRTLFNSYLFG